MIERSEGEAETYIEAGSLVKETLVKNNKRAGGAYKWTKVGNQAGGAQFRVRR